MKDGKNSNAERFLTAYNSIDYNLRTIYDFKRSMAFNDVVRRSVLLNSIVRKYEEDLIDFGRLRNSIIHNGNNRYIIAEPHDDIVEKIEKLAEIIAEPPKAIARVGNKDVVTVESEASVADVMELIWRTGYSNLPVYSANKLIGVIYSARLLDLLGSKVSEGADIQEFITKTKVGDIIELMGKDYYYMVADESIAVDQAMNFFENNRKLLIILITKEGKETGKPLCIISSADIIDMKKILDVY